MKKGLIISMLVLLSLISYYLIDKNLIIDKSNETLGNYEFVNVEMPIVIEAEGTGDQIIEGDTVFTRLIVKEVKKNETELSLNVGDEIKAKEYFKLVDNRLISFVPFAAGRSVYGMGTDYKRLKNGEIETVYLHYMSDPNIVSIVPNSIRNNGWN